MIRLCWCNPPLDFCAGFYPNGTRSFVFLVYEWHNQLFNLEMHNQLSCVAVPRLNIFYLGGCDGFDGCCLIHQSLPTVFARATRSSVFLSKSSSATSRSASSLINTHSSHLSTSQPPRFQSRPRSRPESSPVSPG